ncbi:ChaB family protein [Snodgrassella alvi]|uniref:ChaB family protein n=1 Tax=Snodgrassella alvi TaxID=1196083 RepID=UPI0034603301
MPNLQIIFHNFRHKDDLPESVRHVLPVHAQDIFKEAFNSAIKEYQDPKKTTRQ